MKIGITTFHNAQNFGALLQLYALKTYLEKKGHDVRVINYRNKEISSVYSRNPKHIFKTNKLRSFVKSILTYPSFLINYNYCLKDHQKRYDKFIKFINDITADSPIVEVPSDINKYDIDAVICGSDQIWNPKLTNGLDGMYFAHFDKNIIKISYAASMGVSSLDSKNEKLFEEYLKNFDKISVREENLKKYCEKFTDEKINLTIDPTLLLQEEDYKSLIKKVDIDKYLLVYTLSENKKLLELAKKIAAKKNLELVEIRNIKKISHRDHIQITALELGEFLGLIKNASVILTNSFHGTIFSILFKKEIFILKEEYASARLETLITIAGIKDRYISSIEETEGKKKIDYKIAHENIKELKKDSEKFLEESLIFRKIQTVRKKKEDCTGCGVCEVVCPVGAITMEEDIKGFKYPKIDFDICTQCGLCRKTCEKNVKKEKIKKVYAAKAKDNQIRKTSQSGGIGYLIAKNFIKDEKGIVYGATLTKDMSVKHIRVEKLSQIKKLSGSKYVQSDMDKTISSIKQDLKNDKKVMFIGTPCQVGKIKNALEHKNLYTCDFVCHGVPSPKIYKDYLKWLEEKYKNRIVKFNFRDKKYKWGSHHETITFENGKEKSFDYFKQLFEKGNILREACYECDFATLDRSSDITIGDCWGIKESNPEFYDENGVSIIFTNNEKGKLVFSNIQKEIEYIPYKKDKYKQPNLYNPTKQPETYNQFWDEYHKKGLNKIINELEGPFTMLKKKIQRFVIRTKK